MSLLAEPELLGHVTVPSGTLVVLDAGLMNFWKHDGPPTIPEGVLSSDESEEEANNAKELRVVGSDARAAGIAFDRSCHPLYVYDVPPQVVAERTEQFAQFAKKQGFDARLEPLAERVPHRQRIDQHLENGIPENSISFHGIWAAVATGLPAGQELSVLGRRRSEGTEFEGRWHGVYIEVLPGVEIARSEMRGYAAVDEARLMFADIDALGSWVHEDPLDGKADFAFWGRDAEEAAKEVYAERLDEANFGWKDRPIDEAVELGTRVEELRGERGWKYGTDFRPHSHHWQAMEQVRASETESGTVSVGGASMCVFMTSWGDGLFEVYADYDDQDRLARVRVALGTEKTLDRMRKLNERWFGEFSKMAFVSQRVFEDGQCVRFIYREDSDREQDSGWRVFAGGEDDEYANDPSNVAVVPLRELLEKDDSLEEQFRKPVGSVFERESCDEAFQVVTDWEPEPEDGSADGDAGQPKPWWKVW